MAELRGKQATPEVKAEWRRAFQFFTEASVPRPPAGLSRGEAQKFENTYRIQHVAEKMNLTRKQAKRRVRNYRAWQNNVRKGLVEP